MRNDGMAAHAVVADIGIDAQIESAHHGVG
ncbi:hypothetical protein QFZ96_003721 [Paraburkholderia youngii]